MICFQVPFVSDSKKSRSIIQCTIYARLLRVYMMFKSGKTHIHSHMLIRIMISFIICANETDAYNCTNSK